MPVLKSATITVSTDSQAGRCWTFEYVSGDEHDYSLFGKARLDVTVEGEPYATVIVPPQQTSVTLCGLDRDVSDPSVRAVFTPLDRRGDLSPVEASSGPSLSPTP